jgi:hypothetical protein
MFQKINLKNYQIPENTVVLDGSVFVDSYKENRKHSSYSVKIVDAACRGMPSMITDLELGKFRRIAGQNAVGEILQRVKRNPSCSFYEVMIADYLIEYGKNPAYCKLFALYKSTNLHVPDLTSIIASVEADKILVTNDNHHWQQQNNIIKAYREKHAEKRAKEMIKKMETNKQLKISDMRMFDSKDFCDFVLHI